MSTSSKITPRLPVAAALLALPWVFGSGEAIYGTRSWKMFGEGPTQVVSGPFADTKRKSFTGEDFRFTRKGNALYAIALAWPESGKLLIKSLAAAGGVQVGDVRLLGHRGNLKWQQTSAGLEVALPAVKPGEFAYTLKISGKNP